MATEPVDQTGHALTVPPLPNGSKAMNKKKRIAVAYLVSFFVNGVFWLVYARELRQASANVPKPKPGRRHTSKPLVLGQFKPLPPLPEKEVPPPAPPGSEEPEGDEGQSERSQRGRQESRRPPSKSEAP